jgi:hypothetical protein
MIRPQFQGILGARKGSRRGVAHLDLPPNRPVLVSVSPFASQAMKGKERTSA